MYDILKENLGYLNVADCKNISDTLFKRFRNLIVTGKLPAGMALPNENVMSEMLGVGRSSLREAYTALALSGFIVRSKSGTYINSPDEMINTAPFNMIVEGSKAPDIIEFRCSHAFVFCIHNSSVHSRISAYVSSPFCS